MFDIFPEIKQWVRRGTPFALSTVIKTWGSSPRPAGSALAVSAELEMTGSVSGGCVEGVVAQQSRRVLETGKPERLKFGVSDEDAWAAGLSCGGAIQVWTERFLAFDEDPRERAVWDRLDHCLSHNEGCVLLTALAGERNRHCLVLPDGNFVGHDPGAAARALALEAYGQRRHLEAEADGAPFFAQVFPRKSQLLIVGAAHITADLVRLGQFFDFETIVIDPRGVFSEKTQFSTPPDQVLTEWPQTALSRFALDAYSYAVLLSHDPKIDDQALHLLLRSDIAYHAPIGLDIHAQRPKEIALSIMAEIVKMQNQHAGR
jgi:xanthine dehydrogenase accessory factor